MEKIPGVQGAVDPLYNIGQFGLGKIKGGTGQYQIIAAPIWWQPEEVAIISHRVLISSGDMCHQAGQPVQGIKNLSVIPIIFDACTSLAETMIKAIFAMLMMLAFIVDQTQQLTCNLGVDHNFGHFVPTF